MDNLVRYVTGTVIKIAPCLRGSCVLRCMMAASSDFDRTSSCSLAEQIISAAVSHALQLMPHS